MVSGYGYHPSMQSFVTAKPVTINQLGCINFTPSLLQTQGNGGSSSHL